MKDKYKPIAIMLLASSLVLAGLVGIMVDILMKKG